MEFSNYAEAKAAATDMVNVLIPVSWHGTARSLNEDMLNPNRGDYAGTTLFPQTGGRYTAGKPMRGDRWRLTGILVVAGKVIAPGTIIEAAVNDADDNTLSDWIIYAVQ